MWNEIRNMITIVVISLCLTALIITCTIANMNRDKEYIKQGYTQQVLPASVNIVWTKN